MGYFNSLGKQINVCHYNATHYGIESGAGRDNTSALQALIDLVYQNGGGVIWLPVGTYYFDSEASSRNLSGNVTMLCEMRSGVSIIGESLTGTVLKVTGTTSQGSGLFCQNSSVSGEIMMGNVFENFTVDMTEASLKTYSHRGKAFYFSGIKDCVFRDLRIIGTPSTSLGIDMLDNVVIDSVYVYQGGRQWTYGGNGGAGIGIGTGKWENENYVIRNCICEGCGHFGIFLEDQGIFSANKDRNYPKGQIISNNIIRNGRHYGIGVRGGEIVMVTGNNIYECVGGIYMDYGVKNVMVTGNIVSECTEAGLHFGNEDKTVNGCASSIPCENIVVRHNAFFSNAVAIKTTTAPKNSLVEDNVEVVEV